MEILEVIEEFRKKYIDILGKRRVEKIIKLMLPTLIRYEIYVGRGGK
jgi:hypothetical protein